MAKHKCGWCVGDPLYEAYHDQEWGVPVYNDDSLFEFLILERHSIILIIKPLLNTIRKRLIFYFKTLE